MPRPLVLYIHGGGFFAGQARAAGAFADFPAVLAELASRGYVVASLNYRLSGEARFPAASDDVAAAIRFLRAHAAEYGIDGSRVAVWGGSAGGQLAAYAATVCHPGDARTESAKSESDCVQAAVIWYGLFDFRTMPNPAAAAPAASGAPPPSALSRYLGCDPAECRDVATAASPIAHVDSHTPPMLLIHGTADTQAPVGQSRAMIARLAGAGVPARLIEMPGVEHSFIGETPEATRAASLQALQATFDFFDDTVGRP